MHCTCQMHKVIGSQFNMNIFSQLVEVNTHATPPSYQRDKIPFSQIKSKSGRYKRKVKVGEFLRKMCSFICEEVPELDIDTLTGKFSGEAIVWNKNQHAEKKENSHGMKAIKSDTNVISMLYAKDLFKISDVQAHELHMRFPVLPTISAIKTKREELNNCIPVQSVPGVSFKQTNVMVLNKNNQITRNIIIGMLIK